ncbi:hypothetical protein [Crenobacter cavernae]|uniref:hypothetical protein n=1 Tax=Crenobacter cavernae TaxID=2290923 RepID=UPI0014197C37|nr:hypothetical protein [Crenobacter cavernae]
MPDRKLASRLVNAALFALVMTSYGLWFGVRLLALPVAWLWWRLQRRRCSYDRRAAALM